MPSKRGVVDWPVCFGGVGERLPPIGFVLTVTVALVVVVVATLAQPAMSSEKPKKTGEAASPATSHEQEPQQQPNLALPAEMANPSKEAELRKLIVNGDSVAMDELGPMVVNTDGTLSRITNWHRMSQQEKTTTLRVLKKRNAKRLQALGGQLQGNIKVREEATQHGQPHKQDL